MKKKNLKTFSLGTPILKPEFYDGANWFQLNYSNATVSSVGITGSIGLGVSGSPITTSGNISLTLGSELQGLAGLSFTGFLTRTGAGTYASRALTAGPGIVLANGNGVSGNPTIAVNSNLDLGSVSSISASTFMIPYDPLVWVGASLTVNNGYVLINSTNAWIPYGQLFAYFKLYGTTALIDTWSQAGLPLSMKCAGSIAAVEFEATSSIKKKNILENLETFSNDLKKKFDSIDFVKYQWKDAIKEGQGEFFGYIAENVVESFPELVDMEHKEFAPSILQFGIIKKNKDTTHKISCKSSFAAKPGDKIQLFSATENQRSTFEAIVCEKIDDCEINVEFEKKSPLDGEIFLYGIFEEVPLVAKTRFHDMVASRVKILINDFDCLAAKVSNLDTQMNALYLKN